MQRQCGDCGQIRIIEDLNRSLKRRVEDRDGIIKDLNVQLQRQADLIQIIKSKDDAARHRRQETAKAPYLRPSDPRPARSVLSSSASTANRLQPVQFFIAQD